MYRALTLAVVCAAASAHADVTVDVKLTPQGEALAQQLGVTPAELAQRMRDRIDSVIGASGGSLQAFSDTAVLSSHGLGVDYVSVPESLIVGVAANAASSTGGVPTTVGGGLAANVAVMAGMNLTQWRRPRWTLYGSGYYQNATLDGIDGHIANGAAHVQYALVMPGPGRVARWTGLQVTTGVEFTRWTLGTQRAMSTKLTVMGSSGSARVGYDPTGSLELGSTTATIPVELSTGVRLAVISLYAGVGVDVTQGQGTIDAHLTGPLHDSDGRMLGTVTIDGHDSRNASPLSARALGGVQIEAWKIKIFGHVNAAADAGASVGVGVRGVF